VHAINQAPRFTSLPTTAVVQGSAWTYVPAAEDPEGDGVVAIELVEGPRGMAFEGGEASWSASAAPGEQVAVRFAATDALGARGYQSFSLSVGANPLAPVALVIQGEFEIAPGAVLLDGSPRYDPLGRALSYSWAQIEGPEGAGPGTTEAPRLTESSEQKARAVLSRRGTYRFELVVTNGVLSSGPAGFVATVINVAPVAAPGETQEIDLEDGDEVNVTLDGTGSYDPNPEDTFACVWSQVEGPPVEGFAASTGLVQEITLMQPAGYAFALTCADQELTGNPQLLGIAALDPTPPQPVRPTEPVPDAGCGATPMSLWLLALPLFVLRRRGAA
jgi:hypothetical protein